MAPPSCGAAKPRARSPGSVRTETANVRSAALATRYQGPDWRLGGDQAQQGGPAIRKNLPLLSQGDGLSHRSLGLEIVAEYVVSGVGSGRGLKAPEAAHRVV